MCDTVAPLTEEEALDIVRKACCVLEGHGIRPTRVLLPIPVFKTLESEITVSFGCRVLKLGHYLLDVTVTSSNPSGRFATAYSE